MQVRPSSFKFQAAKSERTLAHWVYEPYEWEYFVWGEWRRMKAGIELGYHVLFGVAVPLVVTIALLSFLSAGWSASFAYVIVLGLLSLGVVAGFYKIIYEAKRSWYKELHRATPEVTITADAVIYGDPDYTSTSLIISLQGVMARIRAEVEGGDFGMLTLSVNSPFSSRVPEVINVLIPRGKEDEAYALVEEFRSL